MSSLTKKLLFFWVLSIVCNFTTSDINECKASVHEVFFRGVKPGLYLKYAMFSLSEDLIKSMGSTQEYVKYYEDNKGAVELINNSFFTAKHKLTTVYFRLIKKSLASNKIREELNEIPEELNEIPEELNEIPEELNEIPEELKKKYILGYFKSLVSKFKKNSGLLNSHVMSPYKFCAGHDKTVITHCREALYKMLDVKELDPQKKKISLRKMKGHDIFMYCYEKYTHLDFTMAKFFPESSSSSRSSHRKFQENHLKLGIMANYLTILTDVAAEIANKNLESNNPLFPTIEEYCSAAVQLQPKE